MWTRAAPRRPAAVFHLATSPVETESGTTSIVAGLDVGLGIDVALAPNMFLRGEWEYIAFAKFHGIHNAMNTGRVGVGVRF